MKKIQVNLEESLLLEIDQAAKELKMSRSAFIRAAVEQALCQHNVHGLEELDEAVHTAVPVSQTETNEWLNEQAWGAEWAKM
jgi:metal-responsive CopG/Arc/MetJ family transcriptional regulator